MRFFLFFPLPLRCESLKLLGSQTTLKIPQFYGELNQINAVHELESGCGEMGAEIPGKC